MSTWDGFYGPNVGYALELFEKYQRDPQSVDTATRAFFDRLSFEGNGATAPVMTADSTAVEMGNGTSPQVGHDDDTVNIIVKAARLARSIREYGHLAAKIDPLGSPRPGDPMLECETHGLSDEILAALPATIVWPTPMEGLHTCLDAIARLRDMYQGSLGFDFDHVQDYDERTWLHDQVEHGRVQVPLSDEDKRNLLLRLTEVEGFERFLHTAFQGQKRFSIEGNDALVPMLDDLVHRSADTGVREVLMGMSHRGRLNVLAHVLGKRYSAIFSEFQDAAKKEGPTEGSAVLNEGWTGDVKYHLGAQRTVLEDDTAQVQITLADNPSHLEFVNPVVEGFARAAQDNRDHRGAPQQNIDRAVVITIHGDAGFPGEGVVAETLNLSRLPGYQTGGTFHVIVNNQIGFTTLPNEARSTLYASDLAKGFEIPVVHVNADDPEACMAAVHLAYAYRERFHKDFLIDLVGYRRWGHNEGDEPSFTQPRLYAQVHSHPSVRAIYAEKLEREGVLPAADAEEMLREVRDRLAAARSDEQPQSRSTTDEPSQPSPLLTSIDTAVSGARLRELNESLLERPEAFVPHDRLERMILRRRELLEKPQGIDWSFAENLALASILADGTPVRLTGQDTERGTFSQRHLVLHCTESGDEYVPLQEIPQASASFAVYNSPLSESSALGFEYGYSVHAPEALVIWEAQFGDFANVAQVIIDQFIAAAMAKWRQRSGLMLLLPHGYEGQGPEHSSARLERYLQLAADNNLRVANLSRAAQYFHLLRLQAATLSTDRRPLVLMTPKSLLRHPRASASLSELTHGRFHPVIDDPVAEHHEDKVERLVFCSGKVTIDLQTARETRQHDGGNVAIASVELLYPFPRPEIENVIQRYPNIREVVWLQEEPQNMGAWTNVAPRLRELLPTWIPIRYIGREPRASTAEGSPDAHSLEQHRIVDGAFETSTLTEVETRGVQHVG
jgi:2-oxoglutarate dehydrogenase E1 component